MTKENEKYGQDSGELPCRSDFIVILVGTTITAFCVWVINSYESAQQGYKWVVLGLVTLFSGVAVLGTIWNIIENYFKDRISYRFKESLPIIFWSLILNGIGVFRLYESFERPDANNDGLFTITDIGVHAKETFFATGDRFTVWIANTSVGQFFEMNTITPSPISAFIVSYILWFSLFVGLKILITSKD